MNPISVEPDYDIERSRLTTRVYAYALLLTDELPSFGGGPLSEQAGGTPPPPPPSQS